MAMNTFDVSHKNENKILSIRQHTADAYSDISAKANVNFRQASFAQSFVGINDFQLHNLNVAIHDYHKSIEDIINNFNQNPSVVKAFKGDVADSLSEFIVQIKYLLVTYVNTLRALQHTITEVKENYSKNVGRVAVATRDDADALRKRADSVSID